MKDETTPYRESLRLALSYREKARGLSVNRSAAQHRARANRIIEAIRAEQRARLAKIESRLRHCGEAQVRLGQELSLGRVSPEKANEASRKLAREISSLQHVASDTRTLIGAESTEALGGFEDLPLDSYERTIPPLPVPTSTFERAGIGAVAALMAVSLLLRWPDAPGLASPWLRAICLLGPILAVLLAFTRASRATGAGLFVLGLAAAWLAGQPVLHVLRGETLPMSASWMVLRPGPLLFGAGGIALVALGALRLTAGKGAMGRAVPASALVAGAAMLALVALLMGQASLVRAGGADIEMAMNDPESSRLLLTCRNNTSEPLTLRLGDAANAETSGKDCVFSVAVLEKDHDAFREVSASTLQWHSTNGEPVSTAIDVGPGLRQSLLLDLNALRDAGLDAVRARVTATFAGRNVRTLEVAVSRPSVTTATASPATSPRIYSPAALVSPESAPSAASPEATVPPKPTPITLTASIVGRIGGNIVVGVRDAQGNQQEFNVMPGDEIAPRWRVDAVSSTPVQVTLSNRRSGEQVTLTRGSSASLRVD